MYYNQKSIVAYLIYHSCVYVAKEIGRRETRVVERYVIAAFSCGCYVV